MKKHQKRGSLRRWFKERFGSQNARIPDPDTLRDGIPKKVADEIELVSRIENITWMEAANRLIEDGFINYLVKMMDENSDIGRRASQLNLPRARHTTRFDRVTTKFAKERGRDKK
jgi:hypothetical protein